MKLRLFLLLMLSGSGLIAQEYWDRDDFEIGNRSIESTWIDFAFNWQESQKFNISDGLFLNVQPDQNKQIDMLAVISNDKRYQNRTIDIGLPIPKKEKKVFEFSSQAKIRDQNDIYNTSFNNNPFYRSYSRNGFNSYRYNPYGPFRVYR